MSDSLLVWELLRRTLISKALAITVRAFFIGGAPLSKSTSPFPNVTKYQRAADDPHTWARMVNTTNFDGPNGCWLWGGSKTPDGYGIFTYTFTSISRTLLAHRLALHIVGRPVPGHLSVDHLCRNHGCVNPDHLEPVTPAVNSLRGNGYYAVNARKTHCVHGHEFSPENTAVYTSARTGRPYRVCRTCSRNAAARHRAAR